MIFEKQEDIDREIQAIERFVKMFDGTYKKLDPFDVDFKVFDKERNLIAYVEVKGILKDMSNAYPLPISVTKVAKLISKRLNPVVIWACTDGIIYGKVHDLTGETKWGGRPPREGSANDEELMVYYPKQRGLKYLKFT
jgi:hypothetical protein